MTITETLAAIIEWQKAYANGFSFYAPLSGERLNKALRGEDVDGDSVADIVRLCRVIDWRAFESNAFAFYHRQAMDELDEILVGNR